MRRAALTALGVVVAACALAGSPPAQGAGREAARAPARWVRVSVATLWVHPGQTRAVDAPALACPADPRAWVRAMSTSQRRWLVGRLETQALYGAKVYVLGTSGGWSHVAVAGQPTRRDRWGYPGWLPTRQLTDVAPAAAAGTAVLRRPAAWLYDSQMLDGRVLRLSYGTRLPVVSSAVSAVEVTLPGGGTGWLRSAAVFVHENGTAWPALTGRRLVAEARRLLGVPYVWAGASGYCFDCSGLTHAVFRALGRTIPRDAGDQARSGRRVATRGALRPGDLVFFRNASGVVHHVGLYVGAGKMIHAPGSGGSVTTVSLSAQPYRGEFAGGRRLTP